MKYLKKFEDNINEPEVGDYVSIIGKKFINHLRRYYDDKDIVNLKKYLLNFPGKIHSTFNDKRIGVTYGFDVPEDVKKFLQYDKPYGGYNKIFNYEDINAFGKTIEELKYKIELKNNINKFNI